MRTKLFLFLMLLPVGLQAAMLGPHAEKVKKLATRPTLSLFEGVVDEVKCLSSEEDPFLIGLAHQVVVDAPFSKVVQVFEDFNQYPEIFDSLEKTKLLANTENKQFEVEFESKVPIPFVSNSTYQLVYEVRTDSAGSKDGDQKVYQFELVKSKDLKSLDGIAIIRRLSASQTLYQELDFLDAKWGVAKSLASKSIWKDTVEETINTDYAMKFRSESPLLKSEDIKAKAEKIIDQIKESKLKPCIATKGGANEYLDHLLAIPEVKATPAFAPINKKQTHKKGSSK